MLKNNFFYSILEHIMADFSSSDYYKILGINKSAKPEEIKKAYRKLALKWHPDKNQKNKSQAKIAEENFKKIGEAYEILSDKSKRKQYDMYGKDSFINGMSDANSYNYGDFIPKGGRVFNMNNGNVKFSTFTFSNPSDIFDKFFASDSFGFADPFGESNMYIKRETFTKPNSKTNTELQKNTKIIIHNLQKQGDLNGHSGTIINYNSDTKRYRVRLSDGKIISLKYSNIIEMVPKVKISNLTSKIEYNNKTGDIIDWDNVTKRFKVRLFSGPILSIKSENIILPKETLIYIKNLTSKVHYNGKLGKIISFNGERYKININTNDILSLKPENISIV